MKRIITLTLITLALAACGSAKAADEPILGNVPQTAATTEAPPVTEAPTTTAPAAALTREAKLAVLDCVDAATDVHAGYVLLGSTKSLPKIAAAVELCEEAHDQVKVDAPEATKPLNAISIRTTQMKNLIEDAGYLGRAGETPPVWMLEDADKFDTSGKAWAEKITDLVEAAS